MKPAGEPSQQARLLVIGHGLSVICFLFALHFTAAGCRIIVHELGSLDTTPEYGWLLMNVDEFLKSWWFLAVPIGALTLWLDRVVASWLVERPNQLWARVWAYAVFVPVLLNTALSVMWFRWWLNWWFIPLMGPLGMPG